MEHLFCTMSIATNKRKEHDSGNIALRIASIKYDNG